MESGQGKLKRTNNMSAYQARQWNSRSYFKETYVMLSDVAKECHEYFMSQMTHVFGDTIELVETKGSYDWHGYFLIRYWYKPVRLYVTIEAQSWYYTVRLDQEDGCFVHLNQIQNYPTRMTNNNIAKTIEIIKNRIDKPMTFYKSTGNGLYRKEGDKFIKLSRDDIKAELRRIGL